MEHYNNFKFLFLLLRFFVSIFILRTSSSLLNIIMGWDGLGITSILLIIFYPNKNTSFNSILTIFFNRLGDVILILILGINLFTHCSFFEIQDQSSLLIILLAVCSFTKRAQFPLSSWLPAAMSAPTPISAMVHSSTLVTAGLFLGFSFFPILTGSSIVYLVLSINLLTFLIGGSLANVEKDFKKIVAFSTMSQIRIIFCFMFLGIFLIGLFHILFHAFFKTLLFCCSGLLFMFNFRDQFKKTLQKFSSRRVFNSFLLSSLFGMRGLSFSSSFFRKDQVIETLLSSHSMIFSILLILGRALTIFYCSSLYFSVISQGSSKKFESSKSFTTSSFVLFSLTVLFFSKIFRSELFLGSAPIGSIAVFLLTAFLFTCIVINPTFASINFLYLSFFVWGIKTFFYSKLELGLMKRGLSSMLFSRDFFFVKTNVPTHTLSLQESKFNFISYPYLILILMLTVLISA